MGQEFLIPTFICYTKSLSNKSANVSMKHRNMGDEGNRVEKGQGGVCGKIQRRSPITTEFNRYL